MANAAELQFILKMRDEASAVLKNSGQGIGGVGRQAKEASSQFDRLAKAAKEAAVAVAGVFTGAKIGTALLSSFGQYEKGLTGVTKTTNMAGVELDVFRRKFDDLARQMNGISVSNLQELAATAGQFGVRGTKDILAFTEVMAKLQVSTDVAGAQGAASIARILNITKEGVGNIKQFGDTLVFLGNSTEATESEILQMATTLASSTAQFGLSSKQLLALSAAAKSVGMPIELFGSAVGRVMGSIKDAAINGSEGMKTLTNITGITAEEMQKLIKSDPTEVVVRFAEIMADFTAKGKSTTQMLEQLNLNTDEIKRVFGTAGQSVDVFRKKLADVAGVQPMGAADQESAQFMKLLLSQVEALKTSWTQLKTQLGESLAPAAIAALKILSGALQNATDLLKAMGPNWTSLIAVIAIAVPIFLGIAKAIKAVAIVMGAGAGTAALATGLGAVGEAAGAATKKVGILGGALRLLGLAGAVLTAGEVVKEGANFVSEWVKNNLGDETKKKLREFRSQWQGLYDFLNTNPFNGVIQSGPNAGKGLISGEQIYDPKTGEKVKKEVKSDINAIRAEAQKAFKDGKDMIELYPDGARDKRPKDKGGIKGPANYIPETTITPQQQEAIKGLDEQSNSLKEIRLQLEAIKALKPASNRDLTIALGIPDEAEARAALQRMERIAEQKKRAAQDPVGEANREIGFETEAARATTAELKNQVEIRAKARELAKSTGEDELEVTKRITSAMTELQNARKAAAYDDTVRELQDQLNSTLAITQAQKNRLEVTKQITDFERQNTALLDEQKAKITGLIEARQRAAATQAVLDKVNPQAAAQRSYNDDVAALKGAGLAANEYAAALAKLNNLTLAQRDPFAAQIKSLNEEKQLLSIQGDYKEADRATQQTLNQLKQQGVDVSKEQVAQLQAANREMQDMKKAESSGFTGWANSVGSLKDNLMDLQKDFASGLSGAISGALKGQSGSFSSFLNQIGGKMIDMSVNQLLKTALSSSGLGNMGTEITKLFGGDGKTGISGAISSLFGGGDTKKAADGLTGALSAMTASTMTVTAGIVNVTGGLGASAATAAGGAAANSNSTSSAVESGTQAMTRSSSAAQTVSKMDPATVAAASTAAASSKTVMQASKKAVEDVSKPLMVTVRKSADKALGQVPDSVSKSLPDAFANSKTVQGINPRSITSYGPKAFGLDTAEMPKAMANSSTTQGIRQGKFGDFGPNAFGGMKEAQKAASDTMKQTFEGFPKQFTGKQTITGQGGNAMTKIFTGDGKLSATVDMNSAKKLQQQIVDLEKQGYKINDLGGYNWREIRGKEGTGKMSNHAYGKAIDINASKNPMSGELITDMPSNTSALATKNGLRWGGDYKGRKDAMHFEDLQKYPGERGYVPGQKQAPPPAEAPKPQWPPMREDLLKNKPVIDPATTGSINAAPQQAAQAQQAMAQAQTQTAMQFQTQMQTATQQVATQFPTNFQQPMQQVGQQFGQVFSQGGQGLQQLAQPLQNIGSQAMTAVPSLGGMAQGLTGLIGPLTQAVPGLGQFGGAISSLLSTLMSSGGGLGGGLGGLLGGLFHEGGVVGAGHPASGYRAVPAGTFKNARRYHGGGGKGLAGDEYPAILQRGERVLTASDNAKTTALIGNLADKVSANGNVRGAERTRSGDRSYNQNITVVTPDANSFRKSNGQIMADSSAKMQRMNVRNN